MRRYTILFILATILLGCDRKPPTVYRKEKEPTIFEKAVVPKNLISSHGKPIELLWAGYCVEVVSGDTVFVQKPSQGNVKKELAKVKLCEIEVPQEGQPFSTEARRFTEKLILNKAVVIKEIGVDFEGTTLAFVQLHGEPTCINHELLVNGFAWTDSDSVFLQEFEDEAFEKQVGLWSDQGLRTLLREK